MSSNCPIFPDDLHREISKIRNRIKKYDLQQRRLISLFRHKEIPEDCIFDEMNQLKTERLADTERLTQLEAMKQRQRDFENAEIRLEVFEELVHKNLDRFIVNDKKAILNALEVKVSVADGQVEVQGVIPANLLTIERTSA